MRQDVFLYIKKNLICFWKHRSKKVPQWGKEEKKWMTKPWLLKLYNIYKSRSKCSERVGDIFSFVKLWICKAHPVEKCQIIQSIATEPFLEPRPSLRGGWGADTHYLMVAHGKCIEFFFFFFLDCCLMMTEAIISLFITSAGQLLKFSRWTAKGIIIIMRIIILISD